MSLHRLVRSRPAWVAALAFGLAIGSPHMTDGKAFVRAHPPSSAPPSTPWVTAPPLAAPLGAPEARTQPQETDDEMRPARIELGRGGQDLLLSGDLDEGIAVRVGAILATHPRIKRLHLTSDGGLVEEAMALGRLVTARGLSTYVPESCASACTLVFAHGRRRYLAVGGQLGYHAPYEVGADGRMIALDPAPERAAYRAAGLPRSFVARVMTVAPADIWVPDAAKLRAAGIVTDYVAADRFPAAAASSAHSSRAAARYAGDRGSRRRVSMADSR